MHANHEGAIEHAIRKQHEWGRAKGTKHGDGTICGGNGDEMGTQGDRQRFLGAMRKKGGAGMQQPPCSDGGARQWRRTGQPRAGHGGETAAVRPQKPTNSHKGVVRLPGQHPSPAAAGGHGNQGEGVGCEAKGEGRGAAGNPGTQGRHKNVGKCFTEGATASWIREANKEACKGDAWKVAEFPTAQTQGMGKKLRWTPGMNFILQPKYGPKRPKNRPIAENGDRLVLCRIFTQTGLSPFSAIGHFCT